ncbi:hypothetical protein [Pseudomonas cremoricolorata]|nr:hypothetical protein [Pseudomonas cremoricolorata]
MQSEHQAVDPLQVRLSHHKTDYNLQGFRERYARYLRGRGENARALGWVLIALGAACTVMGIYALIVRPSQILYLVSTGPTWFQYVQAYAAPIASMGGMLFGLGCHVAAREVWEPVVFMANTYRFVTVDGQPIIGKIDIEYLDDDRFTISFKADEANAVFGNE